MFGHMGQLHDPAWYDVDLGEAALVQAHTEPGAWDPVTKRSLVRGAHGVGACHLVIVPQAYANTVQDVKVLGSSVAVRAHPRRYFCLTHWV